MATVFCELRALEWRYDTGPLGSDTDVEQMTVRFCPHRYWGTQRKAQETRDKGHGGPKSSPERQTEATEAEGTPEEAFQTKALVWAKAMLPTHPPLYQTCSPGAVTRNLAHSFTLIVNGYFQINLLALVGPTQKRLDKEVKLSW